MARPTWAERRPEADSKPTIPISSYAYRLSLYPEWQKFFEDLCRRASHPSIDLAEPNPNRAIALVARQALVNEIAKLIEDGKNKPPVNEVNENG